MLIAAEINSSRVLFYLVFHKVRFHIISIRVTSVYTYALLLTITIAVKFYLLI